MGDFIPRLSNVMRELNLIPHRVYFDNRGVCVKDCVGRKTYEIEHTGLVGFRNCILPILVSALGRTREEIDQFHEHYFNETVKFWEKRYGTQIIDTFVSTSG